MRKVVMLGVPLDAVPLFWNSYLRNAVRDLSSIKSAKENIQIPFFLALQKSDSYATIFNTKISKFWHSENNLSEITSKFL